MTPATGDEDDYRLRLVQADGTPPPHILCTLPSHPTLYLTAASVFVGPAPHQQVLDPLQETRIPAAAIERPTGVAFLQSLGAELPPRVRDRAGCPRLGHMPRR